MDALQRALAILGRKPPAGDSSASSGAPPGPVLGARRPWWFAYGIAVVSTGATLLVLQGLGPEGYSNPPVIVFIFPIILSAYLGGLGPGLLSTAISTLATVYIVLPPAYSWQIANPIDNAKWISLCGAGTLISFLMAQKERAWREQAAKESGGLLRSTEHKVQAGFAALLACLVAIAAVSFPTLVRLREDTAWVVHTHQVIAALRLLDSGVTDAESDQRGFIITGSQEYLGPYRSALRTVNGALGELRRLTQDSPDQQQRLDVLGPLIAERLGVLQEGIDRRDQATALISSGKGKQLQEKMRSLSAEMEAAERALLIKREAVEERLSTLAKIEILAGSALAVIIVAAALWMIGEAFAATRSAEAALRESLGQLDARVGERTRELSDANELLRTSEARFRAIVETSHEGIVFYDAEGAIRYRSPSYRQISGFSDDERVGRSGFESVHPDDLAGVREAWIQVLADPGTPHRACYRILHKDGSWRSIETTFQNLLGNPHVRAVVATSQDVTDRQLAAEALVQKAQELARSNADLEQFAYAASHDLKEPLRAVSGFMGLLQRHSEGKLDELAAEYIAHAADGARRMENLIDGLLAFSRVGTRGGSFANVESARALDTALQNLAAVIEETGAQISHDELPCVQGDAVQLASLFQNLIANALKFRKEEPPRVHVGAERTGRYWQFSVRDNGIGIAPQYFARIFGVFQRLHTRREYPGTGIGLAICKKIVERHGGRIWVESVTGSGSTFYFSLLDARA